MSLERLAKIDRRIIWVIVAAVLIYCTVLPPKMPMVIESNVQNFYNLMQAIPDGSKILYDDESGPSVFRTTDVWPLQMAVLTQLAKKNCVFLFFSTMMPDTSDQEDLLIISSGEFPIASRPDYAYGKDVIIMGWIGGMEAGLAGWAKDFTARNYDYNGVPIMDMPLIKNNNIKTAGDFDVLFVAGSTGDVDAVMRQVQTPYKMLTFCVSNTQGSSGMMQYIASGQIKAIVYGPNQGAQYESLINKPGLDTAAVSSMSASVIMVISFIVISNIPLISKRRKAVTSEKAKE